MSRARVTGSDSASAKEAHRHLLLLERLQHLLRDSRYTTTYKFAVLHALCDLALEMPVREQRVPLTQLAERVMELYWQQVIPFQAPSARKPVSLRQSTGGPAAVLQLVTSCRSAGIGRRGARSKADRQLDYTPMMLALLKKDVLRRLQPGATPFLYRMPIGRHELELCPGVADALRRFHGLLTDTIQARWTAWIEQRNPQVRGSDALREHLFGIDRIRLRAVVQPLLVLQAGRCFYSGVRITERTAEVDHVLPWSLTRNNSVGNLVLASKRANLAKGDRLPTAEEVKRWIERNRDCAEALARIAELANLDWRPASLPRLLRVQNNKMNSLTA
jgi:5-methylcytosine-specific restriction endonuclease McrA